MIKPNWKELIKWHKLVLGRDFKVLPNILGSLEELSELFQKSIFIYMAENVADFQLY